MSKKTVRKNTTRKKVGRGEAILKSADHPLEPQVTFPTANRERAHTAAEAERGRGAGSAKKRGEREQGLARPTRVTAEIQLSRI